VNAVARFPMLYDLLAIDPGNEKSGYVWMRDRTPILSGVVANTEMLKGIDQFFGTDPNREKRVACEIMYPRGMPMSGESMETLIWSGRFIERVSDGWHSTVQRVNRHRVKLHLCGSAAAKDGNVRQAIIDRYGGKEFAIGRKAQPGPLYGIASHIWAALAVGLYAIDNPEESTS
jgi:hypothetical protein